MTDTEDDGHDAAVLADGVPVVIDQALQDEALAGVKGGALFGEVAVLDRVIWRGAFGGEHGHEYLGLQDEDGFQGPGGIHMDQSSCKG